MDFDRLIQPSGVPEKPWRVEALARLVVGIVLCCFAGGVLATVVRYFAQRHHAETLPFLFFAVGAFTCFIWAACVAIRPWPFEKFLQKLLALLLCIYGAFFLLWLATRLVQEKGQAENSPINILIGVLAFQGAALVLVHFFLRDHHMGWAEGFGFRTNVGLAILFGTTAGLVAVRLTWWLEQICAYVLESLHLQPKLQETVVILQSTEGWQKRVVMGVATILIAPVAEEVLFRGLLYPAIKRAGFPRLAWSLSAVLFAAVHVNLVTFVPLVFLALVFTWLYEHTGNLLSCICAHSIFNAANFIALFFIGN